MANTPMALRQPIARPCQYLIYSCRRRATHPSCQASLTGGCIQDETQNNVPSIFAGIAQTETT